jgi:hypothetical protein
MLNGNSHALSGKHRLCPQMDSDGIEAINEMSRKQLSALRSINNVLEVKMKEQVRRLEEEMVMRNQIKANEFYNSLWDGQELGESKNEQIELTIANDEKSVVQTKRRVYTVETDSSGEV